MIERHYDDESLIALIGSDPGVAGGHLPGCRGCRQKLESFRMIADALRDEDVWDMQPLEDGAMASTIASLRAFADQMTDEDARAEGWLPLLLAGARESWRDNLARHPEYRTAGMVRKLIAATDRAIDTMPADAVEIAALAIDIADHLDPAEHPSDSVFHLRGSAWREKAFALYYTGHNVEAATANRIAESHFRACAISEYDSARVGVVNALIARATGRFDEAITASRASADVFERYGDSEKFIAARSAEAGVLANEGRFADALEIWKALELTFETDDISDTHVRLVGNVGHALRNLGRNEEALREFQAAAEMFDALGNRSESARIRWNVALLLVECSRYRDAALMLEQLLAEFAALSMSGSAALVALDLAEIRLLEERQDEVARLCSIALTHFTAERMEHTDRALRAVSFVRGAARNGRATPELVRHVKQYVRRLPAEPALLFLPLPS